MLILSIKFVKRNNLEKKLIIIFIFIFYFFWNTWFENIQNLVIKPSQVLSEIKSKPTKDMGYMIYDMNNLFNFGIKTVVHNVIKYD